MKSFKEFISESIIPKKSLAGDEGEIIDHDGGYIDIRKKTDASPRSQSVIDFQVPEEKREQGIGDALVKKAKEKYNDLGAQVSSLASLKVFHNNGFRHPNLPNGSFEDHKKEFENNWGSLFVAHKDQHGKPYVS